MKKSQDSFNYFILLSVGFHSAIFVFLTVKILFFPSEVMDYKQAVRVDVVALPEKQEEPPKSPAQKPKEAPKERVAKKAPPKPPKKKPKPITPPPKKIVQKKPDTKQVKEEQNSAIERLKALQKLKEKNEQKPIEYKGNALSKGNALTGIEKLHYDSYLEQVKEHIRSSWNLPELLASSELNARVALLINRNGAILKKEFTLKSGNDLFDQYVIEAIEEATPLPAPPSNLIDFLSTTGFEMGFPE